jgi:23S rRNA pseudouridine2605 synthase
VAKFTKDNSKFSSAKSKSPFEKFHKKEKEPFVAKSKIITVIPPLSKIKKDKDRPATALEAKIKNRIKKLDIEAKPKEEAPKEMRLNKYLSNAGIASRRKADELILEGKVTVNGVVVTEMGHKIMPSDKVTFDGKRISPEKKVYILLNKPKDCITTTSDEKDRKTVLDLVKNAHLDIGMKEKPRLYPVGRLDRNTTGVLLITNDGELAQNLTHPSREIQKIYHAVLDKKLTQQDFEKIKHGVVLEDGIAEVDELAFPNPKNKAEVGVRIHSGKNRIVRRIFESVGYQVEKLDRVFFGGLTKKDVPRGRYRFLSEAEIIRLKHFKI